MNRRGEGENEEKEYRGRNCGNKMIGEVCKVSKDKKLKNKVKSKKLKVENKEEIQMEKVEEINY